MKNLTAKEIIALNTINTDTDRMEFGNTVQEMINALNGEIQPPVNPASDAILEGTPVNAVDAKETLTISGVVIDGEKVTINNPAVGGVDVYEFASDVALTVGEGNIPVNINAATVKATDGLTIAAQPTSEDAMTIGTKTYIFVPNNTATADGEISRGTSKATAQANIVAAIRGTDGHNIPHAEVTCDDAFLADVLAITALVGGVAGNSISTVGTFTSGANVFSAATLQNGTDCSATDAVTALVAAITAFDTQGVGATDGAGDTVILTADVGGVSGNAIVIGETMTNGTFTSGAVHLSGGVDASIGTAGQMLKDSAYLYICISANTMAGKNWRRISLGTAY